MVYTYASFQSTETLTVSLDGNDYVINVTAETATVTLTVTNGLAWIDGSPESGAASSITAYPGDIIRLKI